MRSRHPIVVMITGAIASSAIALMILFLTSGYSKSEGQDSAARRPLPSPMESSRPVLRAVTDPLIEADFADPDLIKAGSTYYAYATNAGGRNLQVAKAPAVSGPWTVLNYDGLPALGKWASAGLTWAPEVLPRPDGSYLLYYTARETRREVQCIGAAVAASPGGPFSPVGAGPLLCPKKRGDTIDPAAFQDDDGTRYLLYRSGSGVKNRPTAIYIQRVGPDGLTLLSAPVRILTWDGIEPRLVEAPALIRKDGRYYLFYANGDWRNASYRTGYATATAISGPYRRAARPLLSTERFGGRVVGPGGADLLRESDGDRIVFHGVLGSAPPRRGMYAADLGWIDGQPVVRGVPERYEAEAGRFVDAYPRADLAGASGGKALGYLDKPNSEATFDVLAPVAGTYSVRVRYANRSAVQARHDLWVNGRSAAVLEYASGPTDTWIDVIVHTELRPGRNALRLRRVSGEVDLDYLEIA